jgi:DNA-binding transcriptional regulator YiaG
MNNYREVSNNIRVCRVATDLSLKEFSERVGIPYKTMNFYETGRKIPLEDFNIIIKGLNEHGVSVSFENIMNNKILLGIKILKA